MSCHQLVWFDFNVSIWLALFIQYFSRSQFSVATQFIICRCPCYAYFIAWKLEHFSQNILWIQWILCILCRFYDFVNLCVHMITSWYFKYFYESISNLDYILSILLSTPISIYCTRTRSKFIFAVISGIWINYYSILFSGATNSLDNKFYRPNFRSFGSLYTHLHFRFIL